jgi:hypothetical protein
MWRPTCTSTADSGSSIMTKSVSAGMNKTFVAINPHMNTIGILDMIRPTYSCGVR